ncbi:MAG: hypothetical protein ACRCUE_10510 [Bosea sp. (in: a-proteobacteria)]
MTLSIRSGVAACFGVAAYLAAASPAEAMNFSLNSISDPACGNACPKIIVASGEIQLDSDDKFIRFIKAEVFPQKITSVVLMSSPGGNLVGSLKLGVVIRQLGFSVMVGQVSGGSFMSARCFSACAYTLAGGRGRIVPEGSQVGVHKAWTNERPMRDIVGSGTIGARVSVEGYTPVVERYLKLMGVSQQLMALADATPSSDIRILSRSELASLRMMTSARPQKKRRGGG